MISIWVVGVAAQWLAETVNGAGVAMHLGIAFEVDKKHDIESQEAYHAGAFFPDAFYNCFERSQAAEDAHWPPFLKNAINYYHQKYSGGNKQAGGELRSFIRGMFTHQVADVSWHSLQSHQGLLPMIAEMDFDGDTQAAHSFIDSAGDFLLLNTQMMNLSDDKYDALLKLYSLNWRYPIDDIMKILSIAGHGDISKTELRVCVNRGFLALRSELAMVIAYRKSNNIKTPLGKSPLFSSSLLDYYYGGMNQIVNTLQICQSELQIWLDDANKIPSNPWELCRPVFKEHIYDTKKLDPKSNQKSVQIFKGHEEQKYISPLINGAEFGSSLCFGYFLGEPTLVVGAPYEDLSGSIYMISLKDILATNRATSQYHITTNVHSSLFEEASASVNYPSRFGSKIVSWKMSGIDFLVVSEPGTSVFNVFHDNHLVARLKFPKVNQIIGSKGSKQYDLALETTIDFDKDGSDDLVIGSPYSDSDQNNPQSGQILILKGSLIRKSLMDCLSKFMNSVVDLNIPEFVSHKFAVPQELTFSNGYDHFGLSVGLTNDYFLVGLGSMGSLVVFDRFSDKYCGIVNEMGFDKKPVPHRIHSNQSGLFGYSFIVTGKSNGKEWIAVGKNSDSSACYMCGSVVLFNLHNKEFEMIGKFYPTNDSLEVLKFSQFGSNALKITENSFLITSPGYLDGRGAIYTATLNDSSNSLSLETFHVGDSNAGFSDFGSSMHLLQFKKELYLAVGMPKYGIGFITEYNSNLAGYLKLIKF